MIKLSKLNGKETVVNSDQIQSIDRIPESKITMMNGEYLLVVESFEEIIEKIISYKRACNSLDETVLKKRYITNDEKEN